eukprot:scaffold269401_cov31-Tisochrysis_lutea.AAC.3
MAALPLRQAGTSTWPEPKGGRQATTGIAVRGKRALTRMLRNWSQSATFACWWHISIGGQKANLR